MGERLCVTFFLYLLKGGDGILIDLQLKDVDILWRLYYDVHTTISGMPLHINVETQQAEEYVEGVLKV